MYLSGIARQGGHPATILRSVIAGAIPSLVSPALLEEFREVGEREKSLKFHRLTPEMLGTAIAAFASASRLINPAIAAIAAPDPKDQHLWDLLLADPAAVVVTGDRLLRENPPPGREVLSPREFVDRYLVDTVR